MKIPTMSETNPPTTEAAVRDFELKHDLVLPASYRNFLLITNGGIPRKSNFKIFSRRSAVDENIQDFLGIGVHGFPTSELSYALGLYRGGIPDGLLPIANQDLGSYLCLDLRNGTDHVVFWDHRHFWSTGEWREQDLFHVADSFEQLLDMLEPVPDQTG